METLTDNLELLPAETMSYQFGPTTVETAGWDPLDDEDEPEEDEPIEEISIEDDEAFDDEEDSDDFDIDQS